MSHVACVVWTTFVLAAALSCTLSERPATHEGGGAIELFDGRVIPAMPELLGKRAQYELRLEWLAEKHELLLDLMRSHRIETWIVVSEEFHADPVMQYVAPPLRYTRRRDVMVFVDAGPDGLKRYSDYWRPTEDYARFFEPFPAARNARGIQDTRTGLKALWERYQPETIALNMEGSRGHGSGSTHDTYRFLADALGPVAESPSSLPQRSSKTTSTHAWQVRSSPIAAWFWQPM